MHRSKKKRNIVIFSLVGILLCMVVGYAAFQTRLEIKGTSKVTSNWNILITNVTDGTPTGSAENAVKPSWKNTSASMEANLYDKGDAMEYDVTIENKGTIDAKLNDILTNLENSNSDAVIITFSGYKKGEVLKSKTSKVVHVKIAYNPEYEGEETSSEVEINFDYVQENQSTDVPDTYLLTYDYATNGGDRVDSEGEYLTSGSNVDLSNKAYKTGWTFVGWNTDKDAEVGLTSYQMKEASTTLYAIYSKALKVTYEKGEHIESISKIEDSCTIYNNESLCEITLPTITPSEGYAVDGWYNEQTNVGLPNSKYNLNNNITLMSKAIQTDKEGPTINFDPNSQSNYTNGTEVDINLEDVTGIKAGQEISYAWSTSNTESPFTEGSTALGEVNGTGVVSPQNYVDDVSSYAKYDFKKQGTTWVSANKGTANSYAGLSVKFTLTKTSNFSFDFNLSSDGNEFYYEIWKDGSLMYDSYNDFIHGDLQDNINGDLEAGSYEFYFYYINWSGNTTDYDDTLKISNITIDGMPVEGLPIQTSQIGNKEGAKSATITAPKSLSSNYTGTYYLWVKGGIEDILGNASADKVSGAFKFDNSAPTVSISTSSTTHSITVTANASSLSGITKYEFSMDGETWYPSNSNIYTFTGLDADTRYTVGVRVTNGIGKTSMTNTGEYTEAIPLPTFTESGTSEKKTITITYPEGCGSTYTCSYIKDDGQPVEVKNQTVNVDFTSDGTLIGIVSDGTNEISNVYEVEMLGTMRSWDWNSTSDFHAYTYKNKITSAEVVDYKEVPDNAVKSWDVSEKGNGSVMAWIINDPDNSGYYKLYIGGDGGVRANPNSAFIFYSFSNLTTVDLTKLDTNSVTNMSNMFGFSYRITELDLSSFDTRSVTNMSSMFKAGNSDGNLINLDLSNFDTSNVTDMSDMFTRQANLQELDVSSFDTSKVTNMSDMFYYCSKVTSLDVSSFDTSNVTSMSSMFYSCRSLTGLDVSSFDTSKVTNMSNMFYYCSKVTSLDVSSFDTSKVTSMSSMFYNCSKVTSLNVSNWDTSNVTSMTYMFHNCRSLTSLNVSNWTTSNVTNMSNMFYYCSKVTSLDVSSFDTSKVTNMDSMFSECSSLTSLDVSSFDTSKVTNMSHMFYSCSKVNSLNVSNWDTSNVTNMSNMFYYCSKVTSLDVSNWTTSNVTTMNSMFSGCSSLTSLDVSGFDTSNVKYMNFMFHNCSSLTSLNVSNWITSNVTTMNAMFSGCSSLTSLDVSSFDTSKVTTMNAMFSGCSSLTSLDVSSFDTSKVTNMDSMFYNCSALETLDLSNFDTSKVTSMSSMFYNCSKVTSLNVSNWDTSNVTSMGYMFYYCSALETLDLSNFDTSKVTYMNSMFYSTPKLTVIYVGPNWTTAKATTTNMFYGCGVSEVTLKP